MLRILDGVFVAVVVIVLAALVVNVVRALVL